MSVVVVGSCNLDLIVEVEQLPAPGQTVLGGDVAIRPGGKGANQAVAARRLGADVAFVGAVGGDQFGATLRQALRDEGVDLDGMVVVEGPSGVALIVVDRQAENVITVAPGANYRLTGEHLRGLRLRLTTDSVLLLQLEIPISTCVAAASVAREAGARVIVNAAPLADATDPDLTRLLELTDLLIVNEGEALSLHPGARPGDIDGWRALAATLSLAGPPAAIITLGESGAVAAEHGVTFAVAGTPVRAIDTTGAGDTFCGALAAALADGRALDDAVRRGCASGALATTAVGAQAAMPTVGELDNLLSAAGVG